MSKKDSVALVWCDNGMVDGKFMQGVTDVMLKSGVEFATSLRSQGNQIARQKSFKARHAKNIAKGKMSAAYWADKVKW